MANLFYAIFRVSGKTLSIQEERITMGNLFYLPGNWLIGLMMVGLFRPAASRPTMKMHVMPLLLPSSVDMIQSLFPSGIW